MKAKRTNYRVNIPNLKAYAAKVASNGVYLSGYQAATEMLQEVMFAQKGNDKRPITLDECVNLIRQGGFK